MAAECRSNTAPKRSGTRHDSAISPASSSIWPPSDSTTRAPRSTIVNSSNSGRCPGSAQPEGLRMCAMLRPSWPVLARPTYSSISLGGWPAAATRLGCVISSGIVASISQYGSRRPATQEWHGGEFSWWARRARLAAARGYRYLYVDASPDSQPILARLGFSHLARTTPYVWDPRRADDLTAE